MSHTGQDLAASHFNEMAQRYEEVTGGCTKALARHIAQLPQISEVKPSITSVEANILDNACGTCFVTEDILKRGSEAHFHAVDAAPNMIDLAKAKLGEPANVHYGVMPGEILDFPDDHFTHSFTNCGILFFKSPAAGAKEVWRTLQPGGIAIVTSWSRLGTIVDGVVPAQLAVHPNDEPFKMPIPAEWFDSAHIETTLRDDGGFRSVEMQAHRVFYGAPTKKDLSALVFGSYKELVVESWSEEDTAKYEIAMEEAVERAAQEFVMNDGNKGFGLPMDGIIAICRK